MIGSFFNYGPGPLLPMQITLPAAAIIIILLLIYWKGLRKKSVPLSRRRVRRANTLVQMLLTINLVYALSIVDGSREPSKFTMVWVFAIFLLLITIGMAMLDAVNSYRLHVRDKLRTRHERMQAMQDAAFAMRENKLGTSSATTSASSHSDSGTES